MFDLADLFFVWLLTLLFCFFFTRREFNHLRDRIRAQNEEITRLSRLLDGYRSRVAKDVAGRFGQIDWPTHL